MLNITTDLLARETARMLFYEQEAKTSPSALPELEDIKGRVETIKELLVASGEDFDEEEVRQRALVIFLAKTGLSPIEVARLDEKPAEDNVVHHAPASVEVSGDPVARLMEDFPYFCKMCLEIAYRPGLNPDQPEGGYGPLVINAGQRKVAAVMLDQWLDDKPVRIIILKSRQLGITTLLMAFWLWLAIQKPGITIMIIIDKGDHLNEKRQTYIRWLDRISELFPDLPGIERRQGKAIELQNMSRFLFESAESPNPGTSEHITILHTSEKPKWPRGRDRQIDASVVPGIPEKGGTIYVDESTAEGVNGFYYRWHRVVEGKADGTPIFLPWYISSEYQTDPPESCYDSAGNFIYLNDDVEVCETDESGKIRLTEEGFCKSFNITIPQLYWRRQKIKNAFNGDRGIFDQEYPTSPRHAWQTVGGKFFTFDEVERCEKAIKTPIMVGNIIDSCGNNDPLKLTTYGDYKPSIVPVPYGSLKINEMPIDGEQYFIGGDVAEGRQTVNEAGATDYDYTVFVVKNSSGVTVALFRDRIKPEEAALPLILLGIMYNVALINCERNGPGQVVWSMFRQSGYYNIYYRPGKGNILDRAWAITTASNRAPMLYALRASYREEPTRPGFAESVAEMNEVIIDNKGKIQARKGAHDDIFMAEAHCWSMIYKAKGVLIQSPDAPVKEKVENSFSDLMDFNGIERW